MTQRDTTTRRTVVGNISLSLDGRVTGRGGDSDMSWVAQHAISNASREFMVRVTSPATTAPRPQELPRVRRLLAHGRQGRER